ncbi:MAG: hypothetical protein JWP69_1678 [Flaviaesturariibacter sp.]|nr:hypothetical protein [Flaviaesturariibacter sp.]
MANPNSSGTKCPGCTKTGFELVEDFPSNANYKMWYIRCAGCKTFMQALPYSDTNYLVKELSTSVTNLRNEVQSMNQRINANIGDLGSSTVRNFTLLSEKILKAIEELKEKLHK